MNFPLAIHHIKNARIDLAFQTIEGAIMDLELRKQQEFCILQSRFNDFRQRSLMGLSDERSELNRIIWCLLEWLGQFQGEASGPETLPGQEVDELVSLSHARLTYELHQDFFQKFSQVNQDLLLQLRQKALPPSFAEELTGNMDVLQELNTLLAKLEEKLEICKGHGGDPRIIQQSDKLLNFIYQNMSLMEVHATLQHMGQQLAGLDKELNAEKHPLYATAIILGIIFLMSLLGIFFL